MKDKNKDFDDDNRVYADMSVLDDIAPKLSFRAGKKVKQKLDEHGMPIAEERRIVELTKEEKREIAKGVIKAHLLYALCGFILLLIVFFVIFKIWLGY